ncbi:hypothetical protein AAHB37_04315 [Glutamicibacter halophytocola]|uniref:hypothetical protein n=1 Tax=Glutamicibacter halophytocola TaxID=1933880 RepID=UPI00321A9394
MRRRLAALAFSGSLAIGAGSFEAASVDGEAAAVPASSAALAVGLSAAASLLLSAGFCFSGVAASSGSALWAALGS